MTSSWVIGFPSLQRRSQGQLPLRMSFHRLTTDRNPSLDAEGLNIPSPKLTRGLMTKYLRAYIEGRIFSTTNDKDNKSNNMQQTLDNAA